MKTAYISGHLKISSDEFDHNYLRPIREAMLRGDKFVVGDARGKDAMAQTYLFMVGAKDVTVYHMFDKPRNNKHNFPTVGGFKSDDERDAAMTAASDYDIAWVRPGRETSGTANNLKRRKEQNERNGAGASGEV